MPRTTLQAWTYHRDSLDAEPDVVKFFESGWGLAILHRITITLHLVFVEQGAGGVALVSKFLKLTGLDRFVASSEEAQRRLNIAIETAIVCHAAAERPRLACTMPEKEVSICQDETFTGGLCLVAIEPESGFIVLERTAADRTATTWNEYMTEAMIGMERARIVQSTSDEAKGILHFVEKMLDIPHSPDLFHVQQELSRAVGPALAAKVRAAERDLEKAKESVETVKAEQQDYIDTIESRGPGRPKHYVTHIVNRDQRGQN